MLRLDVVQVILDYDVDIDSQDNFGSTPLFSALSRKCFENDPELSYNQLEIVKLLVGRGANIHYKIDSPRSRSPLTLAQHGARYGYIDPSVIECVTPTSSIKSSPSPNGERLLGDGVSSLLNELDDYLV